MSLTKSFTNNGITTAFWVVTQIKLIQGFTKNEFTTVDRAEICLCGWTDEDTFNTNAESNTRKMFKWNATEDDYPFTNAGIALTLTEDRIIATTDDMDGNDWTGTVKG
jgi:hypothetical protein|tara:strand:- start:10323 stop:10646 length:324 start_codon:yes stop_codon:yes gene_type:complete